jgi:hypothetical protein
MQVYILNTLMAAYYSSLGDVPAYWYMTFDGVKRAG